MHDFLGCDATVCERLTITLLHFLWQGAAIGLAAAFLSRVLQRASSQVRYLIHLTALTAMCGSLLVTLCVVKVSEPSVLVSRLPSKNSEILMGNTGLESSKPIPVQVIDANPASLASKSSLEATDGGSLNQASTSQSSTGPSLEDRASSETGAFEYKRYLSGLAPYVTVTYLVGVALLLTRLLRSAWHTRRLGRSASEITDADLMYRMKAQAERLGLRVLPAVRWCQQVPVPIVIGVFRPMVLLPAYAATGLTIDQLQAVIAHELAHIRRYDLFVNVLQRVAESLLFFHPAVWWVSRQMANEREQACDELVLKVGTGRAQYADALVKMAELSIHYVQPPVTALASNGSSATAFKRRILKVLQIDTSPRIRPGRIAAVVSSIAVLLLLTTLIIRGGALASGTLADRNGNTPEKPNLEDEREAWRELDRLQVFSADSTRPGWIANLQQAKESNVLQNVVDYQKLLDDIPTTADFWHVSSDALPIIGRLKSLSQVRFIGCDLRGQMGHLRELQNLRKFESLPMKFLPGDLAELGALKNLEVIDVNLSTWFQTEDETAALLATLTEEERRFCKVNGDFNRTKQHLSMVLTDAAIAKLQNLKQLKVLDLTHTFVTGKGLEALAHLSNLEEFTVDDLHLLTPAGMKAIGSLKKLRRMPSLPSGATGLIEPLAGLQKLEVLQIQGRDLTDDGLSHLKNLSSLKRLDILHSQVTDAGLQQLANLKQLEQLDIRGAHAVTAAGVKQLQEQLPLCKLIHTNADYEALQAANDEPVAQPPSSEISVPPQVELIGLTYDQSLKQTWQPNGQPFPEPDWVKQLPKLIAEDRGLPSPLLLFEIQGLREKPSIQYQHKTAVVSGDTELPIGRAFRQAILFNDLKNNTNRPNWSDAPTMFLSDEAWGPWRKINRDGQFSDPVDENGFYRNAYAEVSSLGIRPLKTNAKTAVDGTAPKGLILKYPIEFIRKYAIEIEAIPADQSNGQPVLLQASILNEQSSGDEKVLEVEWPVDPSSLDHLRMRVRPFRHKYVFENVNYAASQSPKNYTQFNTVYTKLDHDLSKPEVAETPPLLDVSVIDATTNLPVTGGRVTVRWSFDRHALNIVGKPVRRVFDMQEEFDLTEQGTFPLRIPPGMEGAKLQLQTSIRHPDYVIDQSFGFWPFTLDMAADPALAKKKLFNSGVIKLKRGFEISGLVADPLGQPVAGVRVYAATQMPEYLNMPPHAVTDNQGRYQFRVPGQHGFRLMFVPANLNRSTASNGKSSDMTQSNFIAQSITIRKEYGEQPVVKLQSGTRIVGVVRDSDGQPLPDVEVQGNGGDSVYMGFPEIMSRVVTDSEGRYELPAQKLPVDVRVSRFSSLGGWSEPSTMPVDVFMPQLVTDRWGKLRQGEENVFEVGFVPAKSVTLRARAYNAKGQPDTEADIELIGRVPCPGANPEQRLPHWRRAFTTVPDEPGLYELKAPHGLLDARIDLTNEGLRQPVVGTWTRAVRDNEKSDVSNTSAAWPVLDQDDDTIIVGRPAPGLSTLNSGAGAARTFPTRFADEFIRNLMTRSGRALSGPQPFLDQRLFEEVRMSTIAFLSATTQVDPSPEQQQAIIDSMIGQVTDPKNPSYGRFGNYLAFGNAYKDLMWRVQAAAVRKSLTKAELSAVMSGLRDLATPPLPWPDLIVGSGGTVEYTIHEFQSEQIFLGATERLGSVEDEKQPGVVHLDQAKLLSWPKHDVPTEVALQRWVFEHGSGDVGFVPSRDELVAFRKGKLLKLDTSDWWAIDQLSDDELRARIEKEGGETVSMAEYPKHGFRAITPDPPLIAIRTGPFAGQGQLFVFAVDATDMGMHLHIRSRPLPKRSLDLLKVPQAMSVWHGPSWQGLRTSLTLATERSGPDAPQQGSVLVNLDLFNGSEYPQAVALDPAQVSNWFDIYGPSGQLIPGLVARLPSDLPRDEKGNVIARTIQPGESLRLLENVNLGLAYPFAEPGQYQIIFGGQERTLSLSHGRSCPQSNLLTIDVAAGSVPLIHKYWRLFKDKPIDPPAPNWSLHHASVADPQTLAFRRPDFVYTNWVILTFTDTAEPVPEQKWTLFGIDVKRPWPEPRDVLLGKTELGFAHLLLPPLADKEWPACQEQIKERLREHLRPIADGD